MAHYVPTTGFVHFSGALKKEKKATEMTVTRIKRIKDPRTGEIVGLGQKEIYVQGRRDYRRHPMTDGEQKQRVRWTHACREAAQIYGDSSHPRFGAFYDLWRAQLAAGGGSMSFPNFVRVMLMREE